MPEEENKPVVDAVEVTSAPEAEVASETPESGESQKKRGRPKKTKEVSDKNSPSAILRDIFGGSKSEDNEDGISVIYSDSINEEIIDPAYYLSTGLTLLDVILGHGGLGTGKISEVYGDRSSGKSELAQIIAAEFLQTYPDGVVAYFDQERAIESGKLGDRPIFKSSRFAYCWSPTAEKLFSKLVKMLEKLKNNAKEYEKGGKKVAVLIIIDSVAALLTDAEVDEEVYKKAVAALARTLSDILKKVNPWLPQTNCHLMFLNQIRADFKGGGGWGAGSDDDETPGGKALKFYGDYRLFVKKIGRYWVSETEKKKDAERPPDGHLVQIETVKNKIAPPYRKVVIPLLYNDVQGEKGMSNVWSVWNLLKKRKVINPVGKGYYELKTEPIPEGGRTKFTLRTWKENMLGPLKPFVDKAIKDWEWWAMSKTTLTDLDEEGEEEGDSDASDDSND